MVVILKKTTWVLLFTALLFTNILQAQQKRNYSLSDFIDSAEHHLPVLLQKQALVDAAKATVVDARHSFLPSAFVADELALGTDNSIPGSYLSYGIIPSTSSGVRASNDYQSAVGNIAIFQSQYELLDFGLKKAKQDNAKAYSALTQADLDREKYLLKWQVGKLYFNVLKNQFQLAIEQQNVARYEAIYKIIEAVTMSGIKAGADSSLAMAELSKSRVTFNQTDGNIRSLQQQLYYLTGISPDKFLIDTTSTRNSLSALSGLSAAKAPGGFANPIIDYYNKEELLYKQTETLVKKSYLPRVFLNASGWARGSSIDYAGNYKSLDQGLGYQRFNYMIGASLVYDLFNVVHRKDKLAISHFNTIASDYGMQQQELSLQNVSNLADESIKTSMKNLMEIPVQIKSSQDTYDQKTAQYKAGIINLIDLTNASFVLYRAQSDYVQTLSDWLLANLDKAAATGNLDVFIQSIKK
ncbi:MAG: TolC family protein [Bacteroidetes bacterium]|nr:TolC family protein [Bacteroidota bacterium]MBS1972752.1 TolC family protein [Bacteroidota bacterium]